MVFKIVLILAAGIALFLYSIRSLSAILQLLFTERAQDIVQKYTKNIVLSILIGMLVTMLLQSSSAVIIILIILINASALKFRNAIGLIMGANVGTSFSSQIFTLDIGAYSLFIVLLGFLIWLLNKKDSYRDIGMVVLHLGLLFVGLYLMEESVAPLRDSPLFEEWISRADNRFEGAFFGAVVTVLVQSSSVTVGMAIVLGKQSLITIAGGIALMLGSELGTCSNVLLATVKGTRPAIKAGVFHFLFNLSSIVLGLIFFDPIIDLIKYVSAGSGIDNHIANGHMMFNIASVLLFTPFASQVQRLLDRMIPD